MRVGKGERAVGTRAEKRPFSRMTPLSAEDGPTPILTASAGVEGANSGLYEDIRAHLPDTLW
jgi:hypothetical protein